MRTRRAAGSVVCVATIAVAWAAGCGAPPPAPQAPWLAENPVIDLPKPPLGSQADFAALAFKVTPEKVRLGRFLFYDTRLSSDRTISCASCHLPEHAFSEPKPHSTGVGGQQGNRKAPSFVNGAWPFYPVFFWDGRAASLIEQAKGPMANPIEMGNQHEIVTATLSGIAGYRDLFKEVYGDETIDIDRAAEAIAAYEATRLSGNSPWDRWQAGDAAAVSEQVKQGHDLFFKKADCAQCHVSWNFTDSKFYNLGVGWDAAAGKFADIGRAAISGDEKETGAFKTPTLRDVALHPPYMHDGSLATLRDTVLHYDKGGTPNPWLSERIKPLKLTPEEVDALVAFMESLTGSGYQDTAPKSFPQ